MKSVSIAGAVALSLAVAACGSSAQNNQSTPINAVADAGQRAYSAAGNITAIDGDRVTISHGPVEGLGWPAMTMTFRAPSPQMIAGLRVGDRVAFQFRQDDGGYALTTISKT